jgi:hypothetical protein
VEHNSLADVPEKVAYEGYILHTISVEEGRVVSTLENLRPKLWWEFNVSCGND